MIYYKSCRTSSRKEVSFMEEILVTFLVSVLAGVVSYYICKWLDGRRKTATAKTEQLTVTSKKALRAATLRAFVSLGRFMESRHIP